MQSLASNTAREKKTHTAARMSVASVSMVALLLATGCPDPDQALAAPASTADGLCELNLRGLGNYTGFVVGSLAVGLSTAFSRCSVEVPFEIEEDATLWIGDDPEYIARVRETCQEPAVKQDFQSLVDRGHILINDGQIEACRGLGRQFRDQVDYQALLDATENPEQNNLEDVVPDAQQMEDVCSNLTTGTLNAGDSCRNELECSGELYCRWVEGALDYQCQPLGGEGEECTVVFLQLSPECEEGLTCSDGACRAPLANGQPCQSTGASCREESFCSFANADPEQDPLIGTCQARGGVGDACDGGDECQEDLYCFFDGQNDRCLAPVAEGGNCAAGEDCADGFFCQNDACRAPLVDGTTCDGFALCAASCSVCRPDAVGSETMACLDRGALGDACSLLDDCREGTFCNDDGACAAQKSRGSSCIWSSECANNLSCEGEEEESRTCVGDDPAEAIACSPLCASGETCALDGNCAGDLLCAATEAGSEATTCTETPAVGDSCLDGRCGFEAFCDLSVATGVCRDQREEGASCDGSEQCLTQNCFFADGAETGVCVPRLQGGCTMTRAFFPQVVFFSLFLGVWRLRRLRKLKTLT